MILNKNINYQIISVLTVKYFSLLGLRQSMLAWLHKKGDKRVC